MITLLLPLLLTLARQDQWVKLGPMSIKQHAMVSYGQDIVRFGGIESTVGEVTPWRPTVFKYEAKCSSFEPGRWSELSTNNTGLIWQHSHVMASLGGTSFVKYGGECGPDDKPCTGTQYFHDGQWQFVTHRQPKPFRDSLLASFPNGTVFTLDGGIWSFSPKDGWIPLDSTGDFPSMTWGSTAASTFDQSTVVIFGGKNERFNSTSTTYVLDTSTLSWTTHIHDPGNGPQPRYSHAMAAIGNDGFLVFGGYGVIANNELTWIFNTTTRQWRQPRSLSNPSPKRRWQTSMATACDGKMVVLHGGTGDDGIISDTWVFYLETEQWLEGEYFSRRSDPPPRLQHGMAIGSGGVIGLFAGSLSADDPNPVNDTWIYRDVNSNSGWELMSPVRAPAARYGHVMIAIESDGYLIYGGKDAANNLLDDTWLYNSTSNKWIELRTAVTPPASDDPSIAQLTPTSGVMYIGIDTYIFKWIEGWGEWSHIQIEQTADRKTQHCMTAADDNTVVMVGGIDVRKDVITGDTWFLYLDKVDEGGLRNWEKLNVTGVASPSPRRGAAMTRMMRGMLIMFGGANVNTLDDCWMLLRFPEGWHWIEVQRTGYNSPRSRTAHQMSASIYGIIMYGGGERFYPTTELSDTWKISVGCPAGYTQSDGLMSLEYPCRPCQLGTYYDSQEQCQPCPFGITTGGVAAIGSSSCNQCRPDTCNGQPCKATVSDDGERSYECSCSWIYASSPDCSFPYGLVYVVIVALGAIGFGALIVKVYRHIQRNEEAVFTVSAMHRRDVDNHRREMALVAKSYEIGESEVIIGERVGDGAAGVVYRSIWRPLNAEVAVKILNPLPEHYDDNANLATDYLSIDEIRCLQKMNHPRVVKFVGAGTITEDKEKIFLMTQFMERGSVDNELNRARGLDSRLTLERIMKIASDVAEGMAYLHSVGMLHRDLKPANVLVDQHWDCYLADFGLARFVPVGSDTLAHLTSTRNQHESGRFRNAEALALACVTSEGGTLEYMAPELRRGPRNLITYTKKSDGYAFGVFLWELCTCRRPPLIEAPNRLTLADEDRVNIPHDFVVMINRCLDEDPSERPEFIDIVNWLLVMSHHRQPQVQAGGATAVHRNSIGVTAAGLLSYAIGGFYGGGATANQDEPLQERLLI